MTEQSYKAKILIADDELTVREILSKFFTEKNYKVDTAESGRDAIAKLGSFKPAILLLDLKMPDMSGEDVLKYIDEKNIRVGVIIITGHPGALKDEKLLRKTYDYMVKPFDLDYLNSTVLTKVTLLLD
ncbi:MAG: response regulator [Candidatus Omnitrophota bacterium]